MPLWYSKPIRYMFLTWTAPVGGSDPNSISGYNIYRGTITGGPYTKLNTLSTIPATSYNDFQVNPGTQYFYVVTSVDSVGAESAFSVEFSGTTQGPP